MGEMSPERGVAPMASTVGDDDRETAFWAEVRADYEATGDTQKVVADRFKVTVSALKWRVTHEFWAPRHRSRGTGRPLIIARMLRVLELQVKDLETEMRELGLAKKRSGEKEVVLLGKLVGNLDKLLHLDRGVSQHGAGLRRSRQMEDIKGKLIERIEQLKRS